MSSALIKLTTSSTDSAKYDRLSNLLLNSNTTETGNTSSSMADNEVNIHFDVSIDDNGIVTDITD